MTGTWDLGRSFAEARFAVGTTRGAGWSQASPTAASSSRTSPRSQSPISESVPANASHRPVASKARSLQRTSPVRERQQCFECDRVSEHDAAIIPARGQQTSVGAQCQGGDRVLMPLVEPVDDREVGERKGDQCPLGIADDGPVAAAIDHESSAAVRQGDATGRVGPVQIEQGHPAVILPDEEGAALVQEGERG